MKKIWILLAVTLVVCVINQIGIRHIAGLKKCAYPGLPHERWAGEGTIEIINNSDKMIWLSSGKEDATLADCIFIPPHTGYISLLGNVEKFTIVNVMQKAEEKK